MPLPWSRRRAQPLSPVGVVLAGGDGRRIGGDKAMVELARRPLVSYPLQALRDAGVTPLAVVAKRGTRLPPLPDTARWDEPDNPTHPRTGVVEALVRAGGRPVLAVAGDLALLDAETVHAILAAAQPKDTAVVPLVGGRLQPLCALYLPRALHALIDAEDGTSLTASVRALRPRELELDDETPFFNVNAPEDVLRADALLRARGG